ncbi:hypothetical protein [Trinickia mobilis]|uniref:hypothetical protein n=1 Tax=Trinickia mobilis TaxID=2816356 RepID=UPI001A8FF283|nr:hypothetical protein [Trinickia mobilis]
MISAQAIDSFEKIFYYAARSRLTVDSAHSCEITPVALPEGETRTHADVVVLTISSIFFRLLLILHFDNEQATRNYYLGAGQGTLEESLLEVSNLCCGAMNQQLVEYFPDLGMSTPYLLSSGCVPYLDQLKPDHVSSYRVMIGDSVRLGATLCLCADAPLDFAAKVSDTTESVGELELF